MRASRPKNERGIALLIALFSIALLTLVVMELTFAVQVEHRRAVAGIHARRAEAVARAGIEVTASLLDRYRIGAILSAMLGSIEGKALPVPVPEGMGTALVRIEDMSGRLDLNSLATRTADGRARGRGARLRATKRLATLFSIIGVDPTLSASVADWVDSDSAVTAGGAEEAYYGALETPYPPRNAPLASFGELALVAGFRGEDLLRLRPFAAVLRGDLAIRRGLQQANTNLDAGMVNVNAAPEEVLRAFLRVANPNLDDAVLAQRIIEKRTLLPFEGTGDLREVEGMDRITERILNETFRYVGDDFRVLAVGEYAGTVQSVEAVLHRTDTAIQIQYWLPRRGSNLPIDVAAAGLADIVAGTAAVEATTGSGRNNAP